MSFLSLDIKNMFVGLPRDEFAALSQKIKQANICLDELKNSGQQGFLDLSSLTLSVKEIEQKAKAVQKKFKRLIVIGIGGSDLGARAIWQALPAKKMELIFLSNPDPDTVAKVIKLSAKEWKKTAVSVVSKSGLTLETLANFMIVRERLIRVLGSKKHIEHIFVTTEKNSRLANWAKEQKYEILEHPKNIGGRFSVLSIVGLFPAACGGVPISRLLSGAAAVEQAEAAKFAGLQYLSYLVGRRIQVLMPYADRLADFGKWYRQLWAESLGKNNQGPTPVAALGPVDQHSQIQLYNDGPDDKTVTFIKIEKFSECLKVPKGLPGLEYATGRELSKIIKAELEGTVAALSKNKRPNATISISSVSPESLGALFHFFMLATAYSGELYKINTYNQPGVEEGKKIAKKLLA